MATWREWRAWCREFKSLGIRQVKEREARSIWHPREAAGGAVVAARAGAAPLRYHRARTQAKLGGGIDSRTRQRWAFITGVAHHDDRDLFLVDRTEHRGGSCGHHPRPQPDRVVHLRHHLFAFAQRLVAAGAAQPFELVRRWADVFGGRVARVGRTPAATGDS